MAEELIRLPGVSLETLEKVIEAFSQKNGPVSNDEIAQLVGVTKETVSRCNPFLREIGVIKGGQKKEASELGKKLGLALHHGQTEDASRYWHDIVA